MKVGSLGWCAGGGGSQGGCTCKSRLGKGVGGGWLVDGAKAKDRTEEEG